MSPGLSVIIPVRNQGHAITHMLDSLRAQDLELEILVVDDASTDDSAETVRAWSAANDMPLRLLRNAERQFGMLSRCRGFDAASAPHVLFVDADDRLLGHKRLRHALQEKITYGCDILHFCCAGISSVSALHTEQVWAAPLAETLRGRDIFKAYAARTYPPVVLWNKIFSRELLEQVFAIARQQRIFRFDDKFLTSLAMLMAGHYRGSNELIYEYKISDDWPLEKFAGRIHDLYVLQRVLSPLFQQYNIAEGTRHSFLRFLERRITINTGKLCIEAEKLLTPGADFESAFFRKITPYLDENMLLEALLLSNGHNASTIISLLRGLYAA